MKINNKPWRATAPWIRKVKNGDVLSCKRCRKHFIWGFVPGQVIHYSLNDLSQIEYCSKDCAKITNENLNPKL
mgnify:CR=1 FL=1